MGVPPLPMLPAMLYLCLYCQVHLRTKSIITFCISFIDGKVTEFPVIDIKDDDIIDTNGAGDAFVGGQFMIYV